MHKHNTRHRRKQLAPPNPMAAVPPAKPAPAPAGAAPPAPFQSSSSSSSPPSEWNPQPPPPSTDLSAVAAGSQPQMSQLHPLPPAAAAPMYYQAFGRHAPIPAVAASNDNRGGSLAPPLPPQPHGLYHMLAAPSLPPPPLPPHPGSQHLPAVSSHPLSLDALIAAATGHGVSSVHYGLPFPLMALPPPAAPQMEMEMDFQASSALAGGASAPSLSLPASAPPPPPPPSMAPPPPVAPTDTNTISATAEVTAPTMMEMVPPASTSGPTSSAKPAETAVLTMLQSAAPPPSAAPPSVLPSASPQNTESTSFAATATKIIATLSSAAAAPAASVATATATADDDISMESKENVPQPAASSTSSRQLRPVRTKTAKTLEVAAAEPGKKITQPLDIALTPADESLLSDYNNLLSQHVELYQDTSGTKAKVGVRCKLCVGMDNNQGTAASYLASSISFISPNIGNIGTRHLLGGKCPAMPPGVAEKLKVMRKTSMAQTKMPGRIGLDAYCRELAAKNGIVPYSSGGGIFYSGRLATAAGGVGSLPPGRPLVGEATAAPVGSIDGSSAPAATTVPTKPKRTKRKRSRGADALGSDPDVDDEPSAMDIDPVVVDGPITQPTIAMEVDDCIARSTTGTTIGAAALETLVRADGNQNSPPADADVSGGDGEAGTLTSKARFTNKPEMPFDASSFVPGSVKLFWECSHCSSLPVPHRAAGSVVFSADPPTLDKVKGHLQICTGLDALPIPRDAKLSITGYSEKVPPIRISWDNSQLAKRSKTIEKQRAALAAGKPWPPLCQDVGPFLPSGEVNPGVETTPLVRKGDTSLVTQYAYTTVTLVRKCYLTQTGGSRGGMSLGYPGLACSFCAGKPGQKRFFYTSADNLRNSFAHIPGHIISCRHAPLDVRRNLQALKANRSEENKKLNRRDHKVFLDQLWRRLHSKTKSVLEEDIDFDSDSDDEDEDEEAEAFNESECKAEGTKSSDDDMDMKPRARGRSTSRSRSRSSSSGSSTSSTGTSSTVTEEANNNNDDVAVTSLPKNATTVVLPEDKLIASDYCFFALAQQMPCLLEGKRQGSRGSAFPVGTPGLACRHCASSTNPREFYFRNADVMANNFSHVVSHTLSCSRVPKAVKQALLQKKAAKKNGSNRPILRVVWRRLQLWAKEDEDESEDAEDTEEVAEEKKQGDGHVASSSQGTEAAAVADLAMAGDRAASAGGEE